MQGWRGMTTNKTETRRVELYNITRGSRAVASGYLVRVTREGRTAFVRFGTDEAAARAYAAGDDRAWSEESAKTLIAIAASSVGGDMASSAALCVEDAREALALGQFKVAAVCALRSLKYSLGILHPTYQRCATMVAQAA